MSLSAVPWIAAALPVVAGVGMRGAGWIAGAGTLLRPALGGGIPGTDPTTPVTPVPTPYATEIGIALFILAALFAFFGYIRGVKRELVALAVIAAAYLIFSSFWGVVAKWVHHFYRLFFFAVVKRGIFSDDPTTAWKEVKDMEPIVSAADDAYVAQLAFFAVAVALAYVLSAWWASPKVGPLRVYKIPNLAERAAGAALGAIAGYLIGVFTLSRIVPGAQISIWTPGPGVRDILVSYGPYAVAAFVVIMILFGWASLGPRPVAKKYNS